ncbi:MAG: adenylate kinase [Oscillospiraceae bacterium]|jgi:adenylate kinase|nr:adenylate kinase [Oscillospiraceae bacterium]
MNFIFLGAPGAGKGTQSGALSEKLGIPTISTGDIIRSALKESGNMAEKLKSYTDKGLLVPDDVVIDIIKGRISEDDCVDGFILDGFPRTVAQAEALEKMGVVIDKVIEIDVSENTIYRRMSGRCVCPGCGAVFNSLAEMKPKKCGVCDRCGGRLMRRSDDKNETVRERLRVYYEQTSCLKGYYEKKEKLVSIDGNKPFSEAFADVVAVAMSRI